jgi:hypothetical protein
MELAGRLAHLARTGQPLVVIEQPRPLEMMTGLPDQSARAREGRPVLAEKLTERAVGIEHPLSHQADEPVGRRQPARVGRHCGESLAGLEQMHMRVLAPRLGAQRILAKAAGRMGQLAVEEIHHLAGDCQHVGLAGRLGEPAEREQDEGEIVEVGPAVDGLAMRRAGMGEAPVGPPASAGQEGEAMARCRQSPRHAEHMRMAEDISQPGGDQGRAQVAGFSYPVRPEMFDETGSPRVEGTLDPARQQHGGQPSMQII